MKFEKSVIDLIKERKSQRTYLEMGFPKETVDRITGLLNHHKTGPFGNPIDFHLIKKEFESSGRKAKIGTYGFISGAQYFIAGEIKKNGFCFEEYGYMLEKIILHLTEWKLGTCWLGGTFNRKTLYGALDSDMDILIPAITPVGYVAKSKTMRENIIRWAAKADNRMEWDKLFFINDFSKPLPKVDANEYTLPLEMVRLAPSASNKQPWRIVKNQAGFHFYLERTPGYKKAFKTIDLQRVDMGIAMAHFELCCLELNIPGNWQTTNPSVIPVNGEEFIMSWKSI